MKDFNIIRKETNYQLRGTLYQYILIWLNTSLIFPILNQVDIREQRFILQRKE